MFTTTSPTTNPERVRTGATLRALRTANAITINELADKSGVNSRLLRYIETGERTLTPANARRVAAVLQCRPIALLNPEHFAPEHLEDAS